MEKLFILLVLCICIGSCAKSSWCTSNTTTVVNVKDFGAKGDGVTNDHRAIQTAFSSLNAKTILIPEGNYFLDSSRLTLTSGRHVIGENATLIFNSTVGSGAGIVIPGGNENIIIEGLHCRSQSNRLLYTDKSIKTSNKTLFSIGECENITIKKCTLSHGLFGILSDKTTNLHILDSNFDSCSTSMLIIDSDNAVIDDIRSDRRGTEDDSIPFHHIYINGTRKIQVSNVHLIGGSGDGIKNNNHGGGLLGGKLIYRNILMDSCGRISLRRGNIADISGVTMNHCNKGFMISEFDEVKIQNVKVNTKPGDVTVVIEATSNKDDLVKNCIIKDLEVNGVCRLEPANYREICIKKSKFFNPLNHGIMVNFVWLPPYGDEGGNITFSNCLIRQDNFQEHNQSQMVFDELGNMVVVFENCQIEINSKSPVYNFMRIKDNTKAIMKEVSFKGFESIHAEENGFNGELEVIKCRDITKKEVVNSNYGKRKQ